MATQLSSVTLDNGKTTIPVSELSKEAQALVAFYNKLLVEREYSMNKYDFTLQGVSVQLKQQLDADNAPKPTESEVLKAFAAAQAPVVANDE